MEKGKVSHSSTDEDIDKIVSEYKSKLNLNEKKNGTMANYSMPNLFRRMLKQILTKVKKSKSASAMQVTEAEASRREIKFQKCDWAKKLNSRCHASTEGNELQRWVSDENFLPFYN